MNLLDHLQIYFGVFGIAGIVGWALLIGRSTNGVRYRQQISTIIVSGGTGVLFALICRSVLWHYSSQVEWQEPVFEMYTMGLLAAFSEVKISELSRYVLLSIARAVMRAFGLHVDEEK